MLEFIGLTAIVYLFLMGVMRLFRGKPPQREIYIIREYEVDEDMEALPDNVVAIDRNKE